MREKKGKPPAKLRLNITKKDILLGEVVNGAKCPIARAAKRATPKGAKIWAHSYMLKVGKREYPYPVQVEEWIDNFDFSRPVKPFKITLKERAK